MTVLLHMERAPPDSRGFQWVQVLHLVSVSFHGPACPSRGGYSSSLPAPLAHKLSSGASGTQTLFRRRGHTNSLPAPRAHKLSSGAAGTQTLFRRRGHTNSLLAPRAHKLSSGAAGTQLSCPHLVSVLRGPPPRRGQHRAASCQCRARLYKRYIEVQRYIEAKHATSCQCPARLLSRRHSAQYHSCVRARADALCRADALGKLPAFIENQ